MQLGVTGDVASGDHLPERGGAAPLQLPIQVGDDGTAGEISDLVVADQRPDVVDAVELEVVGAASNGREAVELFRRTQPDVVTMDLTMPEMDGIQCVEQLVALNSKVLILVVSALADKATAVEAIEKGANGFLCKPFTDRQLNDALQELLSEA